MPNSSELPVPPLNVTDPLQQAKSSAYAPAGSSVCVEMLTNPGELTLWVAGPATAAPVSPMCKYPPGVVNNPWPKIRYLPVVGAVSREVFTEVSWMFAVSQCSESKVSVVNPDRAMSAELNTRALTSAGDGPGGPVGPVAPGG